VLRDLYLGNPDTHSLELFLSDSFTHDSG